MGKKRKTREEKIRTSQRQIEGSFQTPTFSFVKREFEGIKEASNLQTQIKKQQVNSSQIEFLASIKLDLIKTFILASIIFLGEAMLYWLWK